MLKLIPPPPPGEEARQLPGLHNRIPASHAGAAPRFHLTAKIFPGRGEHGLPAAAACPEPHPRPHHDATAVPARGEPGRALLLRMEASKQIKCCQKRRGKNCPEKGVEIGTISTPNTWEL